MAGKLLTFLCSGIVLINFTSCAAHSPQDILDEGMSQFGNGKSEETYYFKNSGALLEELIEKYSGSYYRPVGTPMTDDEHDKVKNDDTPSDSSQTDDDGHGDVDNDDTPPDSSQTDTASPSVPEVSNMTELMRVFHNAYDQTAEYVEFTTVNGFSFDSNSDLQTVYTALQREDPIDVSGVELWSTWNRGNEYYVSISYSFDVDELKSIKAETTQLVADAVKKIGADGMSDYEKVCAVNEYLCDNVYYPDSEPYEPTTHTAYGALNNGCAVCEGYACAAKLILNSYGIECDIEVGDCLNGGGHAWNLVKLDGEWYQLDVTWNDQSNGRSDYLLVTDEYMKKSRTWEESDYPVSSKTPYSE